MMKLLSYIVIFAALLSTVVACNTDPEELDIVTPYPKSEKYYADLRAYKARSDHEVLFGWFGGWTAYSSSMVRFLESVPDSADIISIWGTYYSLSEEQIKDLRFVQQVKGTKVTYTTFAHEIPEEFMSGENKDEVTVKGIEDFALTLVDSMYKYGYDGIDLDWEPGFGGKGPLVSWPGFKDNMEIFCKKLSEYVGPKSGTGKLFLIDGAPQKLKVGVAELFDYGIVQAYNSPDYIDLQDRFDDAVAVGWTPEKYIFTETFEGGKASTGGVEHTLREGGIVPSLEGMARFKPMYNGQLAKRKGGCGSYHMENDYFSKPINYKYTRNAIYWMHETSK